MIAYSVVVVTWECADHLRTLVATMNRHLDGSQELIVVDNASSDSPDAVAAGWRGEHRFIGLEENIGFGAASNVAVAEASAAVTVLLNPDTELLDDGLDRLAAAALARGGLIGPRILNPDGSAQPSASGPEVGVWPWVRALVPAAIQPGAVRARTEPYRMDRPLRVTWLTGACVAGPTAALRDLGPFDPALHMYSEDLDLGVRAGVRGVASWFDPQVCRIVHHGQASALVAYGVYEGYRATAAINRRAALRRAYGRRREWLGWMALRANLRLRLTVKRLLGRAVERDRAAMEAVLSARRVPELPV